MSWRLKEFERAMFTIFEVIDENGEVIKIFVADKATYSEKKKKTQLIAAAPELLEELESNIESINLALEDISRLREYEAFDTDEYNELDELRAHLAGTVIGIEEKINKAKGEMNDVNNRGT